MATGHSVRPKKWEYVIDLYDDGEYSAIWGNFNKSKKRCLGVRWNDNANGKKIGFPSQGKSPTWYLEPEFLTKNILIGLRDKVNANSSQGKLENIDQAIKEC